jgi:FkbM family methyltransferase
MSAVVAATRWGAMVVPPNDQYVGQALIRMGEYCPHELETWLPYLPKGGVIVDAGANIGAHTMPFAFVVGREGTVIAMEPQRMLHHMICGSLALNGLRQVHAQNCALGFNERSVLVPSVDYGAPGNFGGIALMDRTEGEVVLCRTLDSFELPRLDFLKIDVEGAELSVLQGGAQTIARCRPVMSVEADREKQVPALLGILRAMNYKLWWHRPSLGALWPGIISINLLCIPRDRGELPDPVGDVEAIG